MDCLFCKIIAGKIPSFKVWETDTHLAFLDINPIQEGHTLVIPKKHASYVFEMDDGEYHALFSASKIVAERLKKAFDVPRIGIAVEGFAVDHIHIHLIPLTGGDQLNPELAKPAEKEELQRTLDKF